MNTSLQLWELSCEGFQTYNKYDWYLYISYILLIPCIMHPP